MAIDLTISDGKTIYIPSVTDSIKWETSRDGSAGKLTLSAVYDEILTVEEGNEVKFRYNDKDVFFGYVFTKKPTNDGLVSITAYDQLRYFKNKYSYLYNNKTVSSALKELAEIFQFRLGTIDNTEYLIPSMVEDGQTILDIIKDGLDSTITNTGKLYVLYDDFGKVCLRDIDSMQTNILLDSSTVEDYRYESSIDKETYNRVILYYDPEENEDKKTESRQYFKAESKDNIAKWGILQLYEDVKSPSIGQEKANAMLTLHNKKSRTLSLSGCIGSTQVRGGSGVVVNLQLGNELKQSRMLVSKATHTFTDDSHTMDLELEGSWSD